MKSKRTFSRICEYHFNQKLAGKSTRSKKTDLTQKWREDEK